MSPLPFRHSAVVAYVFLLALLGTILASPQVTGDGTEYVAVADNFSRFEKPSLTTQQRDKFRLSFPQLTSTDGRHDVMHFWLYPALASPFVASFRLFGVSAEWAFAVLNVLLLGAAFASARRYLPIWGLLLLFVSPIIWWSNKVHSEVLTFSLLVLALAPDGRPLSSLALIGVAAAQNPPLFGVAVCRAFWLLRRGDCTRTRAVLALSAAGLIAAVHPVYYFVRIGRPTPLVEDIRIPGIEALGYVLWDPNVGLIFNYPFAIAAVMLALVGTIRGAARTSAALLSVWSLAVLMFSFAQTANLNHGGTPGMSRYALWLLPLMIPVLSVPRRPQRRPVRALSSAVSIAAATWSIVYFRPSAPERYLEPTRVALYQWTKYPELHNPLPEIFAERLRHQDLANVLAATAGCEKVLVNGGVWPSHCPGVPVPARCREALCYANRTPDGYAFVTTSRRGGQDVSTLWQRIVGK